MVLEQIAHRGIDDDRILAAISEVPRHAFVPESEQLKAYDDCPLPIGHGQTISQPYMVALMTHLIEPRSGDTVLEIGTGSGYQTAILAELVSEVFTVERVTEHAASAERLLAELGYRNIRFKRGDGTEGWPEHAPYAKILVTASAPAVPTALVEQLANPGLLVLPVGKGKTQDLVRIRKTGDRVEREKLGRCSFVKLIGKEGWN